ncbi:MAG: hypothetical protein IMW98_09435 [Firmicutes bacterium]|nr:hypothetical protein [Bacillota bacterium]
MGVRFRRSFIGLRPAAVEAFLSELEDRLARERHAHVTRLEALQAQVAGVRQRLRQVEQELAAEREEQRALMASIRTMESHGQMRIQQAVDAFEAEEAAVFAEVTHRQAMLGSRRALVDEARAAFLRQVDHFRRMLQEMPRAEDVVSRDAAPAAAAPAGTRTRAPESAQPEAAQDSRAIFPSRSEALPRSANR